MSTTTTTGTDVTTGEHRFDDAALAGIKSFDDALALLADHASAVGGTVESFADYGPGFTVVDDNARLIGVPFVILAWRFHDSSYGNDPFVSVELVTKGGDKLVLNDGGTGIRRQLIGVADQRKENGSAMGNTALYVPGGLRVSEFFYNADTKEISNTGGKGFAPAKTYYLAV